MSRIFFFLGPAYLKEAPKLSFILLKTRFREKSQKFLEISLCN
jgi:hypothetical protein